MTSAPFSIDETTRRQQIAASDPARSAWVSANAGAGKTFVLAQRVKRLLLAGTDPARILCLTFTKAAAAEMSKRVFEDLAGWTRLEDAVLVTELAKFESAPPTGEMLVQARRLFARALETPGGLKIQTIHAFCERLLHQFPFEANVAGHFEVLDEQQATGLIAEARKAVLAEAARDEDGAVGTAFRNVVAATSDRGYEDAVAEFVARRDDVGAWLREAGSFTAALAELRAALGVPAGDTAAELTREFVAGSALSRNDLAAMAAALRGGGPNDQAAGRRLDRFLAAESETARLGAYRAFFLTGEGKVRAAKSLISKTIRDIGLEGALGAELERVSRLLDRIAAAESFETSAAMLTLVEAVIADYERRKARSGFLDFQDLVVKTGNLLLRRDAAQWVHYKLDQGLDHILVDEAQDTSPRQWDVVIKLAEEFFSGKGARDITRTIFAVGDEKQSIYSFQGAVPARFSRVQSEFRKQAENAALAWSDLELHLSFRSSPDVLGAVDAVFGREAAYRGLSSDHKSTVHSAARRAAPGRVIFWPMVMPPDRPEPGDWAEPLDRLGRDSPEVQLAERIAGTIRGWLANRQLLDSGAPIRPGGILILTRNRSALSDAINRALKAQSVPIAGTDRLALGAHIAVLDLLALGDVMLLPEDDLASAALLKSPLFGLDEEALFRLAHKRTGTLWQALESAASDDLWLAPARERLIRWRSEVDFRAPHDFYARILGADKGRRQFAERLGAEAEDVLDEFLAQALLYEQAETPSLQGFLTWARTTAAEIKRDPALHRDEVRVMTVHGAKGLEADIVFLVDDGSTPAHGRHDPRVVALTDDPDAALPAPLAWYRGKNFAPPPIEKRILQLRQRRGDEYRRLLYVGLTRARDRLYICGTAKRQGTDMAEGWHGLVQAALEPAWRAVGTEEAPAYEWRKDHDAAGLTPVEAAPMPIAATALPDWINRKPPAPPAVMRRLTPSSVATETVDPTSALPGRHALLARLEPQSAPALERGRIVHRLLQALPDHQPSERRVAADRYLVATLPQWSAADRDGLIAEVLGVIDDPRFAPVFGPGSRAEVEIGGRLAAATGPAALAGRVDRIAVTPERVLIVDFKTNRPAPTQLDDVPPEYLAQLALYRQALRGLYPTRTVAAALLWTDGPGLMEVPANRLDAAEAALSRL